MENETVNVAAGAVEAGAQTAGTAAGESKTETQLTQMIDQMTAKLSGAAPAPAAPEQPETFSKEQVETLIAEKLAAAKAETEAAAKKADGGKKQSVEEEVAELRTQLAEKELKETATKDLVDSGFPAKLANVLRYESEDSMKASLETVKTVVAKAVAEKTLELSRGKTPPGLGGAAAQTQTGGLAGRMKSLNAHRIIK